jgi:hypothetical protein
MLFSPNERALSKKGVVKGAEDGFHATLPAIPIEPGL